MPLLTSIALLVSGAILRWTQIAGVRHRFAGRVLLIAGAFDCALSIAYSASVGEREARYLSH